MTTQVKQLSGFVSAPAGTDLSQLLKILEENHIQILDPAKFAPGAVKITDKLIESIRHADLVIAVLGSAILSGNVLFELGCASALGKKTLVIGLEGSEIPSDIKDFVYIRSALNNHEAVSFALEQIIHSPEQELSKKNHSLNRTKVLGSLVDDILSHLNSSNITEANVYDILRGILDISNIKFLTESQQIGLDFVVWIDELEPYFGNPILIEVKNTITTTQQAAKVIEKVLNYMSAINNAKSVIIFTNKMSAKVTEFVAEYPNLYFFEIHKFVERLYHESFGEIIIKERNSRFHGRFR